MVHVLQNVVFPLDRDPDLLPLYADPDAWTTVKLAPTDDHKKVQEETPLRVSEQGIDGTFDGLAPDGALRLRREDGEVMLIHAGDVELQRPVTGGN